eukprot:460536-Prymnesium_polylepis.1
MLKPPSFPGDRREVVSERIQRSRAGMTPPQGLNCTQGSAWGLRECAREKCWVLHTNFSALTCGALCASWLRGDPR